LREKKKPEEPQAEPEKLGTVEKAQLEFSLEDAMRILGIATKPSLSELDDVC
jgi:hypothetical protein